MDWVNILISLFSSVITATIAGIFSVSSMKKQLKQTQLMVEDQKKKEILHKRPELEIVSYSPISKEHGYSKLDLNTTPHIDVFMAYGSNKDSNEGKKIFNKVDWVHCKYLLRNVGIQSLYSIEVFSQTSGLTIFDLNEQPSSFPTYMMMNSFAKYRRRRIHKGDTILLRLWYHKDYIYGDPTRNPITLILKDFDKNYWEQPINAPYDFLEESKQIPREERLNLLRKTYDTE